MTLVGRLKRPTCVILAEAAGHSPHVMDCCGLHLHQLRLRRPSIHLTSPHDTRGVKGAYSRGGSAGVLGGVVPGLLSSVMRDTAAMALIAAAPPMELVRLQSSPSSLSGVRGQTSGSRNICWRCVWLAVLMMRCRVLPAGKICLMALSQLAKREVQIAPCQEPS